MDIIKIMNYFNDVLINKEDEDKLIFIRKKEFMIIYDVLNFILEEFTKNIYPETMLVNIQEYLTKHYNYDIWSGNENENERN